MLWGLFNVFISLNINHSIFFCTNQLSLGVWSEIWRCYILPVPKGELTSGFRAISYVCFLDSETLFEETFMQHHHRRPITEYVDCIYIDKRLFPFNLHIHNVHAFFLWLSLPHCLHVFFPFFFFVSPSLLLLLFNVFFSQCNFSCWSLHGKSEVLIAWKPADKCFILFLLWTILALK